jgi:hypothetical protein
MKKRTYLAFVLMCFFLGLWSAPTLAEEKGQPQIYEISSSIQLRMALPGKAWTVSKAAPQYLLKERAEDMKHDLETQGKKATEKQIMGQVEKEISSDQVFVFNPESKSLLEISFSPLRSGEKAPSGKTLENSAKFAGESMTSEEGVTDSKYHIRRVDFAGAERAYRLDIDFKMDGSPRKFIGFIGFAKGNWFFFYYTDRMGNDTDYADMEILLGGVSIQ